MGKRGEFVSPVFLMKCAMCALLLVIRDRILVFTLSLVLFFFASLLNRACALLLVVRLYNI